MPRISKSDDWKPVRLEGKGSSCNLFVSDPESADQTDAFATVLRLGFEPLEFDSDHPAWLYVEGQLARREIGNNGGYGFALPGCDLLGICP